MQPFRTALYVRVAAGSQSLAPALPLQAALGASKSLQYAQTNRLTLLNGGLGWRTPWSGPGSIVLGSPASDRTAAAGNSFLTQGSGGAAFRTLGTNGWDHLLTAQRKFGREGSTLWLSFVLRRDTRPAGNLSFNRIRLTGGEGAEAQLANRIPDPNTGEAYPNVADLQGADAEGFFSVETPLNLNQDGASGQEGHFKPDRLVPGIPGTTGTTQNFTVEILAYLELAEGLHRFGINSDDVLLLTVGRDDPRDALGVEPGVYPADRGAGDSTFSFVAPVAGIYPFRLVRQTTGQLLALGSRHSAEARWQVPGESTLRTATWDFLVEDYPTLPASHAKPRSEADTAAPGFSFRIVQGPPLTELPNTSLRAETQLAGTSVHPDMGELLTNEAQTGPGSGGIFELTRTINFNERGANLSFADGHAEFWRWRDARTSAIRSQGESQPRNRDLARLQSALAQPLP